MVLQGEHDKTELGQPEQNRTEKKNGFALIASELIQEPIDRLLSESFSKESRNGRQLFASSGGNLTKKFAFNG